MTLRPRKNSAPESVPVQDVEIADPCKFKLIYVYRIPDRAHAKILKIGDTSLDADSQKDASAFPPNCAELNAAAKKRIKGQTTTAGITFELLHTEIAVTKSGKAFRDYDVHKVFENSGVKKVRLANANDWFKTDLLTAKEAIAAVKRGVGVIAGTPTNDFSPVSLREEQENAVRKTVAYFEKERRRKITATRKKGKEPGEKRNEFLWNAKMRFGKTLCALEVAKRLNAQRTIIITHRPDVFSGWEADFGKIFRVFNREHARTPQKQFLFGGRKRASFHVLKKSGNPFVYFASLQDLTGSNEVSEQGIDKNRGVLAENWDLIIVDEAHEGTTTDLGKTALDKLKKKTSCVLHLSGTPFNLAEDYTDETSFTWDYLQEQRAKLNWEKNHPGEPNPYASLPQMIIRTYSLGSLAYKYPDIAEKCFKFSEFFKIGENEETFAHEGDVSKFLNLLSGVSKETSKYPFSTPQFRAFFRHTFWIVPGVKQGVALEKLLNNHSVFRHFKIVNVCGDGNSDDSEKNALKKVEKAIRENDYTITLSCGKLTLGVSVPEWTAVFYLAGNYNTSAATYMQTIFRVQTPGSVNGCAKETCYVFDFAPDRTLSVLHRVAEFHVTTSGVCGGNEKKYLGDLLNFLPVIAIDGSGTREVDTQGVLDAVHRAYVADVVKSGFSSRKLFDGKKLLELDAAALKALEGRLNPIVGKAAPGESPSKPRIGDEGLDGEQREGEGKGKTAPRPRVAVPDEEKKRRKNLQDFICTLQNAAIKIPLLVFGAGAGEKGDDPEKTFDAETFADSFDDESWAEFMGKLTKEQFSQLVIPYLDKVIFEGACRRIRERVAAADTLPPLERIEKIVEIHSEFKNPEKETVLTPWKVVNRHLGSTLGGENFFDETFQHDLLADAEQQGTRPKLRSLRLGNATTGTLANPNAKILEINSKTGLYPLYAAYSLMRAKLAADPHSPRRNESVEDAERRLWREAVEKNLFILCRTKMARAIVRRTLLGFDKSACANIRVVEKLVETVETLTAPVDKANLPDNLSDKEKDEKKIRLRIEALKPYAKKLKIWKNFPTPMEFDAIIGNPPYQKLNKNALDGTNGGASASPVYHHIFRLAKALEPRYISLVFPSRWQSGGKGLNDFRKEMLDDAQFEILHDFTRSQDLFPNVDIKGGVCFFRWTKGDTNKLVKYTLHDRERTQPSVLRPMRSFPGHDVFIRYSIVISILEKVLSRGEKSFSSLVSERKPFNLATNFFEKSADVVQPRQSAKNSVPVVGLKSRNNSDGNEEVVSGKRIVKYVPEKFLLDQEKKSKEPKDMKKRLEGWKIFVPKARGAGGEALGERIPTFVLGTPILGTPMSACTETFLLVGPFEKEKHARNALAYLCTKTFRLLVGAQKLTQNTTSEVYSFVPVQDFSQTWTDEKLFKKYGFTQEERDFIKKMVAPMPIPPSTHSV